MSFAADPTQAWLAIGQRLQAGETLQQVVGVPAASSNAPAATSAQSNAAVVALQQAGIPVTVDNIAKVIRDGINPGAVRDSNYGMKVDAQGRPIAKPAINPLYLAGGAALLAILILKR